MRDLLAAFFALILASVAGFIGVIFGGDYVGPVAFFVTLIFCAWIERSPK